MSATMAPARPRSRRRRILLYALGIPMLLALCLGLFAVWSLRVGGDVARLRDLVTRDDTLRFESKVGFRATWPALFAARCVLRAADSQFPSEAAAALGAVRRVDVCVGKFQNALDSNKRRGLFERGSEQLRASGWEPVVRVIEDNEIVGVFTPQHSDSGLQFELMVLVCDGRDLVIARVQCDGAVLQALADRSLADWKRGSLAAMDPGWLR